MAYGHSHGPLYSLICCKVGVGHTCYERDTLLNGRAPFVGVWMSSSWWLGMVIEGGSKENSK